MMTPTQTSFPPTPPLRLAWPHLILAALGLAVSVYAIWAHNQIALGQSAGCSISPTISCNEVLSSRWAKFAGIPLGYFGGAYWILVALTAIHTGAPHPAWETVQRFVVAAGGLLVSAFLFYVSEFLIRKLCPICLATHILNLINFGLASAALWKTRAQTRQLWTSLVKRSATR